MAHEQRVATDRQRRRGFIPMKITRVEPILVRTPLKASAAARAAVRVLRSERGSRAAAGFRSGGNELLSAHEAHAPNRARGPERRHL
jgi:hypothetical protein